jgi:hypothetical protein
VKVRRDKNDKRLRPDRLHTETTDLEVAKLLLFSKYSNRHLQPAQWVEESIELPHSPSYVEGGISTFLIGRYDLSNMAQSSI